MVAPTLAEVIPEVVKVTTTMIPALRSVPLVRGLIIPLSATGQMNDAKDELNAAQHWPSPIVTSLEPAGKFFIAEDYHQEYFANNGNQPYCQFVVAPKVKKFEQKFAKKMKG